MNVSGDHLEVLTSGANESVPVKFGDLKRCRGAGVFVPGPVKLLSRCVEKIQVHTARPYSPQHQRPRRQGMFRVNNSVRSFSVRRSFRG